VPGHDPVDYALVFERVLDDPYLRARLTDGAVAQARRFGWGSTADATLGVYREAVRRMRAELEEGFVR
jgi:D-inositol-3-phosphate glycosyltransferase